MKELIIVYETPWILNYVQKRVSDISHKITNIEKLEFSIYKRIIRYINYQNGRKVSFYRVRDLTEMEIADALQKYGLQNSVSYSDLAITNGFGESLEYEPEDEATDVGQDVLERTTESSLKGKIARLASDDFEEFVLQSWMLGDSDVEIARELALRNGGKVPSLVVKISRFRERCKKRWTKETFVS